MHDRGRVENIWNSRTFIFAMGLLTGIISFLIIYGSEILNVTYDAWIMKGEDFSQHYVGWQFFRNSDWQFPLVGLSSDIIYPQKLSIVYTDSIPIFAIIFKVFSRVLPSTFQYFGVWGIISFALQGGISALIIRYLTKSSFLSIIASVFFVISSTVIQRMFIHTALAGQWIILLYIYIYLIEENKRKIYQDCLIWSSLSILSLLMHVYFFPMMGIFMIATIMKKAMICKYNKNNHLETLKQSLFIIISVILSTLTTMILLGFFVGKSTYADSGLGNYSSNLGLLFNPQGFSRFIGGLPTATPGQGEGLAYLGAGIIILFIITSILFIAERFTKKHTLKIGMYKPIMAAFVVCTIIAYSPTITFGSKTLFTIEYPYFILRILNIFRASGRFMWIPMYLIMIASITYVYYKLNNKIMAKVIICVCVIIQICDLSGVLNKSEQYQKQIYVSTLNSKFWEVNNKFEHMMLLRNITNFDIDNFHSTYGKEIYDFADYATRNNITMNDMYIARISPYDTNVEISNAIEKIRNNNAEKNTIYISKEDPIKLGIDSNDVNIYFLEGYYIYLKEKIKDIENYPEMKVYN